MWSRLADVLNKHKATRLFGLIGAGATLGQLLGSLFTYAFANLGSYLLLISAICLEISAQFAYFITEKKLKSPIPDSSSPSSSSSPSPPPFILISSENKPYDAEQTISTLSEASDKNSNRNIKNKSFNLNFTLDRRLDSSSKSGIKLDKTEPNSSVEEKVWSKPNQHAQPQPHQRQHKFSNPSDFKKERKNVWNELFSGFVLILKSRYLMHMCAYLLCSSIISSFFYFMKASVVSSSFSDPVVRRKIIANINSLSAISTMFMQLFATGPIISRLGVTLSLCSSSLCSFSAMIFISFWPHPFIIAISEAIRKVMTYSLSRPSREILFTVVSQEEKYKAKIFIDTIVHRVGDAVAAAILHFFSNRLFPSMDAQKMALSCIPLCLMWIFLAYSLGKKQEKLFLSQSQLYK